MKRCGNLGRLVAASTCIELREPKDKPAYVIADGESYILSKNQQRWLNAYFDADWRR